MLLLSSAAALARAGSEQIPAALLDPRVAWGADTNALRAGLGWGAASATVVVVTSGTNAPWDYVAPPGRKLLACELRDPEGRLVPAAAAGALTANLPRTIAVKDLPQARPRGHHPLRLYNRLLLATWAPDLLCDIPLQDAFALRTAGEYTLTVQAAVYKFAPDYASVVRLDLPPVSAKVHLEPKPKQLVEPRAYGPAVWNILGLALCLGGAAWLVWHRRAHRPQDREASASGPGLCGRSRPKTPPQ
jgi:hypothetical protein